MNKLAVLALLPLTALGLSACGGGSAQTPLQHCESVIKTAIDNGAKLTTGSAPGVHAACSGLSAADKTKADAYAEVYAASHAPAAVASTPASALSLPATASASPSLPATVPASTPSTAAIGSCGAQVKTWYLASGSSEIATFHNTWKDLIKQGTLASQSASGQAMYLSAVPGQQSAMPSCGDPGHDWALALGFFRNAGAIAQHLRSIGVSPTAAQDAKSGFAALATVAGEIDKYTPAQP
jgi:hypothetical protein